MTSRHASITRNPRTPSARTLVKVDEQEDETGDEADHRVLDHPRRVPVQRGVGDLLHELRVGDREVRLDLSEDPLLVLGERHRWLVSLVRGWLVARARVQRHSRAAPPASQRGPFPGPAPGRRHADRLGGPCRRGRWRGREGAGDDRQRHRVRLRGAVGQIDEAVRGERDRGVGCVRRSRRLPMPGRRGTPCPARRTGPGRWRSSSGRPSSVDPRRRFDTDGLGTRRGLHVQRAEVVVVGPEERLVAEHLEPTARRRGSATWCHTLTSVAVALLRVAERHASRRRRYRGARSADAIRADDGERVAEEPAAARRRRGSSARAASHRRRGSRRPASRTPYIPWFGKYWSSRRTARHRRAVAPAGHDVDEVAEDRRRTQDEPDLVRDRARAPPPPARSAASVGASGFSQNTASPAGHRGVDDGRVVGGPGAHPHRRRPCRAARRGRGATAAPCRSASCSARAAVEVEGRGHCRVDQTGTSEASCERERVDRADEPAPDDPDADHRLDSPVVLRAPARRDAVDVRR